MFPFSAYQGAPTAKKENMASANKHMNKRILPQERKATQPESECERDSDDDEVVPKKVLWKANATGRVQNKAIDVL